MNSHLIHIKHPGTLKSMQVHIHGKWSVCQVQLAANKAYYLTTKVNSETVQKMLDIETLLRGVDSK